MMKRYTLSVCTTHLLTIAVFIMASSCQHCMAFAPLKTAAMTPEILQRLDNKSFCTLSKPTLSSIDSSSRLHANFLGDLFNNNNSSKQTGPKTIVDLSAKTVKIGALRFLLQIYLVGEQNKPAPKSWLVKQGDEGDLQIYYQDGTGMLAIDLSEYRIKATRHGERPSLQYQLQESLLLHGILDELDNVAFGVDDIAEEKRLLRFNNAQAIETARSKLPARKA